eukprot:3086299-Ditylum_brightwellii.AAC.2
MGLIIDFKHKLITWGIYHTIMKPSGVSVNYSYSVNDPTGADKFIGQIAGDNYKKILDAEYEKANIVKQFQSNALT